MTSSAPLLPPAVRRDHTAHTQGTGPLQTPTASSSPPRSSSIVRPLRIASDPGSKRASLKLELPATVEEGPSVTVLPVSSSSSNDSTSSSPKLRKRQGLDAHVGTSLATPKSSDRRHSYNPSSLPGTEIFRLRRLGQRRYSSAQRDDSLTQLLANAKPIDPKITQWLTRSWVRRQRQKASFVRGLLLGCVAGLFVKLMMTMYGFAVTRRL